MNLIANAEFSGERPLFGSHDLKIENVTIHAGESALKECSNIVAENCRFEGKYPMWHVDGSMVTGSEFTPGARAAIWYSRNMTMSDCKVDAPKMFRDMSGIRLNGVKFSDAQETLWHCSDIEMDKVEVQHADYLLMHSSNIRITDYRHQGNYAFQYCKNLEIRNAVIDAKDAFWDTEDVTVYDSEITGEYLGWHSKRLRLVRCKISGTQPLCYATDLVMEDCVMADDADLAFEYSTVTADIKGAVTSVKNPKSGRITADEFKEIIIDENIKQPADCVIETRK